VISMRDINVGDSVVHVLPVIKGLKSETKKVQDAFDRVNPDRVVISLSKEELEGLRNIPDDFEPELSRYDEMYAEGLSKFGEVAAPPPCHVAAVELADHRGVPIVPVDLDESSFTELYCAAVSGGALFRHSTRTWLLRRKHFRAENAEQFVLAWDRAINNLEGFRTIEAKRSETIANGIRNEAKSAGNLLAIVELERAADVLKRLEDGAR